MQATTFWRNSGGGSVHSVRKRARSQDRRAHRLLEQLGVARDEVLQLLLGARLGRAERAALAAAAAAAAAAGAAAAGGRPGGEVAGAGQRVHQQLVPEQATPN
jgi:hypothetical protein